MRTTVLFFSLIFLIQACTTGNAFNQNGHEETLIPTSYSGTKAKQSTPNTSIKYRIYLDNSYSMNGYFKDGSNFLSTVNKLITHLSNISDDENTICDLNYINNGINYFGNTKNIDIGKYLGSINDFYSNDQKGNRKVTDLKDVLKSVIDSIQQNTVNVIITDGIPSPGLNGQESGTYLDILQNCIYKGVYSKLSKLEFITQIIKCKSGFSGIYINQLNKGIKLEGNERPYYIFIMGEEIASKKVAEFIRKHIESSNFQSSVLFNNSHNITVKSKILLGTGYEIVGNASAMKIHKKNEGTNEVKLRILADYKTISQNDEYLLNFDNYEVTPVDAKITIYKITNIDDPLNKGFTHKILLTIPNLYQNEQVKICLKNIQPEWIKETNTTQDINLSDSEIKQKTFGFQYIVNGFIDGYRERKLIDNYFTLIIKNQ